MPAQLQNGIYAAALTPLNADFSCNDEQLALHCKNLISRGCSGVALFGTTGEGPSFSVAEKINTLKNVIALGLDPSKIILANGSSNLPDSVALVKSALDTNCVACLISPPSFYKNISEEGVLAFYREIIKQVANPKLRILLYHIPQYSGVPLTVHIVKTLCTEFPGIVVGLKESEGNLVFTKSLLQEVPNCKVYVGKESQITEAMHLGAAGSICGKANLYPELICSLVEHDNTQELEKIAPLFANRPFVACCKALLAAKETPHWNRLRPPLMPLNIN